MLISPKVAGQVVAVHVHDNQEVKEGDLLAEDPRDYAARLAEARAALDGATARHKVAQINLEKSRSKLASIEADSEQARAQAVAAEAQATRAEADLKRARELLQTGASRRRISTAHRRQRALRMPIWKRRGARPPPMKRWWPRSGSSWSRSGADRSGGNGDRAGAGGGKVGGIGAFLHEDFCPARRAGDAEVGGKRRVRPSGSDPDGAGAA